MRNLDQLRKEEEELEKRMTSTPESEATTDDSATGEKREAEEAHVEGKESVTPEQRPATDEPSEAKTEDWELRYKNLRASRDQKLYEVRSQLSAALATISTLQSELNQLKASAPSVDPLAEVFTDADKEDLGEHTLDAMKRITAKATEAATAPLKKQLEEERKMRREQAQRMAEDNKREVYDIFISWIANAVPNWEKINYDPAFMKWMDGDDYDGTPRKVYFAQAEDQGNAALIIRYMKEYEGSSKPIPKVDKLADKVTPIGEMGSTANEKEGI